MLRYVLARLVWAVVLFWAGQLLAYVFVFGFEPYYDVYADQPERLLGISPLTDQKLAGVVMMVHDLAFRLFPETAPHMDGRWNRRFDRSLQSAAGLLE